MRDQPARGRILLRNLAMQDWACFAFHAYLLLRVLLAPDSPDATVARRFALTLLSVTTAAIVVARGELLPAGRARALVYRLGIFFPVFLSYFELRPLLAAISEHTYDAQLMAIDQAIFGVPPAVWLQRINVRPVIEHFAFFYYGYFFVLGGVLLPSLFLDHGRRLQEVMVGAMVVTCVGHIGYTLVPAFGPHHLPIFDQPVQGGFFWGLVQKAVHGAGAQLDIFPSLHTALPTYLSLHAFGHRDRPPFRYAWPVIAFCAANIVVATMLLRWHWGIDVLAGLCLAGCARLIAVAVARREEHRGEGDGRQPVWEPLGLRRRAVVEPRAG